MGGMALKERLVGAKRRKAIFKDWRNVALEIGKWVLVLWLLWPVRHAINGPVDFSRVVLGILLFVIFAGKLFYDTIIMDILKQRRTSVKQDVLSMIGIVLVLSLVVGLLLFFVGFVIIELYRSSNQPGQE